MYSTYKMSADELSVDFIKALKKTYQHRKIEIIVQEVEDETEYLLSSPANHEHLMRAIENVNNHTRSIPRFPGLGCRRQENLCQNWNAY